MHHHPGLAGGEVYLDYNATTPVDPRVVEAMLPYLREWFGNPSSGHGSGLTAGRAVATARERVARLIGADADEIVFTGSRSEADSLAIRGTVLLKADRHGPPHVITQATEHPAVLGSCAALARLHGVSVTHLPVDERAWSTRPTWRPRSRIAPCWSRSCWPTTRPARCSRSQSWPVSRTSTAC